jgi:hypothetical protein
MFDIETYMNGKIGIGFTGFFGKGMTYEEVQVIGV